MRPLKILHIYKHAAPDVYGGIETVVDTLASEQSMLNTQTNVLAFAKNKPPTRKVYNGYTLTTVKPLFSLGSTPFSFGFLKAIFTLSKNTDIIHLHFPFPFADLCLLLVRPKCPIIVTYHSDIIRQRFLLKIYVPLMSWLFKKAKIIVATSPNYIATSKMLAGYRNKIAVVPIGLPDKSSSDFDTVDLPNGPFFLFIGEFRYYKGLSILIDAASKVDANVLIIGSGKLEPRLRRRAKNLGLDNVYFIGRLNHKEKYFCLHKALAVVFPSHLRSEAFGLTLLEGAMFSKPLISCEIGTGTTYTNLHEKTGLVCEPGNAEALANAMNKLLSNKKLALQYGSAARSRYKTHFTAKKMLERYQKLYLKFLNANRFQ